MSHEIANTNAICMVAQILSVAGPGLCTNVVILRYEVEAKGQSGRSQAPDQTTDAAALATFDPELAADQATKASTLIRDQTPSVGTASDLVALAEVEASLGNSDRAKRLFAEAVTLDLRYVHSPCSPVSTFLSASVEH
jgi:hypothetical protein